MSDQDSPTSRQEILDVFEAPEASDNHVYTFETGELTSQCPFDFGGPDYYQFTLRYIPQEVCVESKSLKQYLESFRDVETTAEELGAEMYTAFEETLEPQDLYLKLEQARRGGVEETVECGETSLAED